MMMMMVAVFVVMGVEMALRDLHRLLSCAVVV